MDPSTLGTIIDLGGQAVLLFILSQVWAELRSVNQFNREMLMRMQEADEDRARMKTTTAILERKEQQRADHGQ